MPAMNRKLVVGLVLLCGLTLAVEPAGACSVPVFRWALQNWLPDLFELVIFHRGALGKEQQAALEFLQKESAEETSTINLAVRTVDVSGKMEPADGKLWQSHAKAALPLMVLLAPGGEYMARPSTAVWTGPLTMQAARKLLDSPARREVAKRIIAGESAVWVLVECGNKKKDDAAARTLQKELARAEKLIELPPQVPEDYIQMAPPAGEAEGDKPPKVPKLAFKLSMLRVKRTDPAEQPFVAMLMTTDEHLAKLASEPMAFPIFGRGRSLCALAGKSINADNILDVCAFLAGACSCMVKEQNPGTDMLVRADWDAALKDLAAPDLAPPPLTALTPAAGPTSAPAQGQADLADAADAPSPGGRSLLRNVLLALGFVLLAVVVITLVVLRRTSRS